MKTALAFVDLYRLCHLGLADLDRGRRKFGGRSTSDKFFEAQSSVLYKAPAHFKEHRFSCTTQYIMCLNLTVIEVPHLKVGKYFLLVCHLHQRKTTISVMIKYSAVCIHGQATNNK